MKRVALLMMVLIAAVGLFAWRLAARRRNQGSSSLSPGPAGLLSGVDHRVRLQWITRSGEYGPGNYGRRIRFDDRERYYEIHVPPGYSPGVPMPVVMVLHGGGGYAALVRTQSGMDAVSDEEGFVAVYPAGTNARFTDRRLTWNTGHPMKDPQQEKVDDVGFLSMVIDDLADYFSIDRRRIYATGISNG